MDRSESSRDDAHAVHEDPGSPRVTRRQALQGAAVAGAAVALGGAPAAAGAGILETAKPRRGGHLVAGIETGVGENWDPKGLLGAAVSADSSVRQVMVYQRLVGTKPGSLAAAPQLAQSWEPNKKGDEWTIHVRRGVEFHNGKTLTAQDVLYSLKRCGTKGLNKKAYALVDWNRSKVIDKYTVRIAFKSTYALFEDLISLDDIVPAGQEHFTKDNQIGTGPFKVDKIFPTQRMNTVRNPNYWESGLPRLDRLDFVMFALTETKLNALFSGQIDAASVVPFSQVPEVRSKGFKILNAPGGRWSPIVMDNAFAPFKDARVRLAMKLLANRPLMVKNAIGGFGSVGNDLFGKGDPAYIGDTIPQRHQDIERAKSLLKQAGQENLTVDLHSMDQKAGLLSSALIFGQEAAKAGVTVNVKNDPSDQYFTKQYRHVPMYQDFWDGSRLVRELDVVYQNGYDEGQYRNPKFYSLLQKVKTTIDEKKRTEALRDLQLLLHDDSPHIIWGFENSIDAYSSKFAGFVGNPAYEFGNFDFRFVYAV